MMARTFFGWGDGSGLVFRNYTAKPKLGACPVSRRALRRHKPLSCSDAVFARDGHTCRKCGSVEALTVDHVVPASVGGSDDLFNLTTLCRRCNTRRGAYLPEPRILL
jgi:ribosomal protein L40E